LAAAEEWLAIYRFTDGYHKNITFSVTSLPLKHEDDSEASLMLSTLIFGHFSSEQFGPKWKPDIQAVSQR